MHVALVGPELEENLTLRYLRAALEAEGHRVTQIDFIRPADIGPCAAQIAAIAPDLLGLSMVFTRRADEFARLAGQARALGYRGPIVAGGHFAAFHAEQLLADVPAIDLIAIGEGERLLCALAAGRPWSEIPGLVYRIDGGTHRTPAPTPEPDLDTLPWPVRRKPYDRYHGLPIVNMLGSRGCTHGCAFC